jgi:hypothetical protein
MAEKLFSPAESGITLGNLIPFKQLTAAEPTVGTIDITPFPFGSPARYVPQDPILPNFMEWLGLDEITVTGDLVDAPEPALTLLRNESPDGTTFMVPKVFSNNKRATFRRGFLTLPSTSARRTNYGSSGTPS